MDIREQDMQEMEEKKAVNTPENAETEIPEAKAKDTGDGKEAAEAGTPDKNAETAADGDITTEDAVLDAVKKAYENAQGEGDGAESEDCSAGNGEAEEAADGKDDMAGGIFGRKLKKELTKKEEELAEQKNSFLRLMAEFDNFRKRSEKEKAGMYDMGAKDVIEKILPVLDNFERGFLLVTDEDREDAFVQGMEKIYKQFITVMSELGVKPIEAEGKEFDPNLHNAVMHVEDENFGENIVARELQKGYTYKDSVVRHSMVTVAN